ncbi:PIN domain-containing protein [Sulfurospirillum sp. 1307]|jgi:predicted nucleic-acid-binding protein
MIRIDTNYILRYLLDDDEKMSDIAENLIVNKDIFIANKILAEVVYVLMGVYKISKQDISEKLIELINFHNIFVSNKKVINKALSIFRTKNLDFVDCILCAYSKQDEIATFDKKLNRCVKDEINKNK